MKSVNPCGLMRAAQRPRFCVRQISVTAVSMKRPNGSPATGTDWPSSLY